MNNNILEIVRGMTTFDAQRLEAAIAELPAATRKALLQKVSAAVTAADVTNSRAARRLSKIEASSKDENMQVAFRTALRGLRRLGLDIDEVSAAGNTKLLDKAMTENKWTTGERLQLKTVLHAVGCID